MPPKKPRRSRSRNSTPNKIAALLDKREPTREAVAPAPVLNNTPALGANSGSDARLSQTEIDALARATAAVLESAGRRRATRASSIVVFRVMFKRDGTIARDPTLIEGTASQFGPGAWRKRQARAAAVPAVHDAPARTLTTRGKTSKSSSTRSDMFG